MLGHEVTSVVLESQNSGYCAHRTRGVKPDPLALGMIIVAGHAAEVLWHRRSRGTAPAGDHAELVKMGFRGRSLSTLLSMAMHALESVTPIVFAIAKELQKRNLTGADVREIINQCTDPLVIQAFENARAESV